MKVYIGDYPGLKSKKPRRIDIKIHSWDHYSADHTIALIVYPLLVEFKKKAKAWGGAPSCLINEKDGKNAQKIAFKKWLEIIDKIIFSFKEIANNLPGEKKAFKKNGKKYKTEKCENGTHKIVETGFDFDVNKWEEYNSKIQEGLELFGKYYTNLWW